MFSSIGRPRVGPLHALLVGAATLGLALLAGGCSSERQQGVILRLWASDVPSRPDHVVIVWFRADGSRAPERRYPGRNSLKPDGLYLGSVLVEIDSEDGERRVAIRGLDALDQITGLASSRVIWKEDGLEEVELRLKAGVSDLDNDGVADDVDDEICGPAVPCGDAGVPDAGVVDAETIEVDAAPPIDSPVDSRRDAPVDRPSDAPRDGRADARVDAPGKPG